MDNGGEKAVAVGGCGPTTAGNESETGHGKGRQRGGPVLTRIEEGEGSCNIDGSTLGRNTSGPPAMEGLGCGCGSDRHWTPS